jgi:PAS domain S-box-containing protein
MPAPKLGRLLIVDDEVKLMNALCETLTEQGYETRGLTSGREALEVLKGQDFDVLLTDLMMPEMDGIALLRAALEIDPHLVGIVMTGQGTVQTAVNAMKTGAFDYVLKPFKMNAILPVLARALMMRRLRMENLELRETVSIYELNKAIAITLDLNSILNKLADAVCEQCKADEVSIMLPTEDGKELFVAVVKGGNRDRILGSRVPIDNGVAGRVALNHEMFLLNGPVKDRRFAPANPRPDISSAISLPMLAGGELVGVLNVNNTHARRTFTLGDAKALSILVSIVAPTLKSVWLCTQAMEAEEKYRSIFENSVEGIYQTTPEGAFISASPSLVEMLGYGSFPELREKVTSIGNQLYVDPEHRAEYRRLIEECGEVCRFETELYRKDGSVIHVSIYGRAIRGKDGAVARYEGIIEDITERKLAEEELKKYREHLEELVKIRTHELEITNRELELKKQEAEEARQASETANRAKSDFLAGMSHELRTPLTSVIGFAEVLEDELYGKLNAKQHEYADNVRKSGVYLLNLINDILDLSKVESGRMELEPERFQLKAALSASMAMFKEKAMKHNICLGVEVGQDADRQIEADERKFKQILFNLLGNALKFTPDGGSVTVYARRAPGSRFRAPGSESMLPDPEPADFVEISVADTGVGIKEGDIPRLFREFVQLESGYTRKYEGTGLGLALVKRLVELHGGKVWAESEGEGKGSTFTFLMPVEHGGSIS